MANTICLRCLSRPLVQTEKMGVTSAASSFSTSAVLSAKPPPKKGLVKPKKGGASFSAQKKGPSQQGGGGRAVGQGERKALRKRVVLSNTNALEVRGMEDFAKDTPIDESRLGQVLGLSDETMDSLRASEAFKPTQGWSMFRRPATLVRKETVEMAKLLEQAGEKQTARRVIYGERGAGKSVLMLQAMAMAFLNNWTVIHIPEAQELAIAHTSYVPNTSANGDTTYIQPHYTATLLGAIAKANHTLLSSLQLSLTHDLAIPVQSNMSLDRFAMLGARDPDLAWPVYQALFKELTAPNRPPIIFTLDAFNHVTRPTSYLDQDLKHIHGHDLALVRHFLNLLSGKEALPNGGLVLAAESRSNRPSIPSLDFAIRRNQAAQDGSAAPELDPYSPIDRRVLEVLEGVDVLQLKGLTKDEARGVMEYYAKSGVLRATIDERLLAEKWTLSGGGIIGELEKATVLARV